MLLRRIAVVLTALCLSLILTSCSKKPVDSKTVSESKSAQQVERTEFSIAWSIYVGWMPWDYAANAGILKKWADKYGIKIKVVQINDYVESINQYTAGQFDGCTMTNMDALSIPAAGGVDSTGLIVGDFSNGNDGIVMKGGNSLKHLKGKSINLVELSVSHYLLARGLESAGLSQRDIKTINTSDADLVAAFDTDKNVVAVSTWNPLLSEVSKVAGAHKVFDSSQIPGEIIDLLVVNTKTLNENPKFAKALTGAWYEIMQTMSAKNAAATEAKTKMAAASGTSLADYESQLTSTKMFYSAKEAVAFTRSKKLLTTMQRVAEFSFAHGLLGDSASNAQVIGIETPQGVYGDAKNIKLRFNDAYMAMAAAGSL